MYWKYCSWRRFWKSPNLWSTAYWINYWCIYAVNKGEVQAPGYTLATSSIPGKTGSLLVPTPFVLTSCFFRPLPFGWTTGSISSPQSQDDYNSNSNVILINMAAISFLGEGPLQKAKAKLLLSREAHRWEQMVEVHKKHFFFFVRNVFFFCVAQMVHLSVVLSSDSFRH